MNSRPACSDSSSSACQSIVARTLLRLRSAMLNRIIPGISWMSLRLPYSACGSALLFGKKIPRLPGCSGAHGAIGPYPPRPVAARKAATLDVAPTVGAPGTTVGHRDQRQPRVRIVVDVALRVRVAEAGVQRIADVPVVGHAQRVFARPVGVGAVDPGSRAVAVDLLVLVCRLEELPLRHLVIGVRDERVHFLAVRPVGVDVDVAAQRARRRGRAPC